MSKRISIIIPFLNEADNVENLVATLNNFFDNKAYEVEVVLVDDGTTDQSVEKLAQQAYGKYEIRLIKLSKNFGAHAAVRAGVQNASGDYVTFLPADLQDPLDLIDRSYEIIKNNGVDIVYAFRKTTNNSYLEKKFSEFYAFLMKKFVNANFPGRGFDIVFFNKKVKENLDRNIEQNSSIQLQILSLGYNTEHIYYDKQERKRGKSKCTTAKKIKLLIDSFVAFSYAPIRLVSMVGILFFLGGSLWSVYIVLRKLILD